MRVLVVEDERAIAELIERGLEAEGYPVTCAFDGDRGAREAVTGDYDLVLLDVLLPKRSGLDILREVRARRPELPVIMLTARSEIEDKVEGLDLGADDYLTKPFAFDELLARIRAQLRKPRQPEAAALTAGPIRLDFHSRRVERAGEEVRLTAREFDLLAYLMRHPNQVLSRAQILSAVWGYDHDPGTNVLEVYIGYLRRKLARADGDAPIETVRGAGYRLLATGD
jgi:DNA-binding response OmpR family regulator